MAQQMSVRLNKGDAPSLGFRLQGGIDFGTPLVIQKVNLGSPAEKAGLVVGDSLVKINGTDVYNLRHKDAQDVIIRAGPSFEITVQRGGTSTWKPSVTPLPKAATPTSFSPVTKTSLAAKPQPSIGSIGTGHNLSAKPFSPQLNGAVNGGPKLVNKQYNSPLGLYSEQSIAETLSAQAEVLSTGVLGVNFKKNEKNYDASNSAVFRMVHEADKEPRDQEPVNRQNFYATHSHAIGGYTTTPRSNTPLSERSNSRQGLEEHMQKPGSCDEQTTTCNECDRVIVGVFVRIKDKNLHVECFKCATCGSSLKNVGYYNINNKLYCDVHAKLAAKSAAPASNLVPVTVLPPGKAPAGTISAALATHPLPTVPPSSGSSNITAQPFQGGNFPSPRPFSSVSAPLSPPVNNYSPLPKASPTAPPFVPSAPAAQEHVYTNNSLLNTTAVNDTHDHHHTSQTTEEKLSSFTTTINLPIKEVLQITDPSKVTISSMESDSFCTTKTESSDNPPLSKNVQLEEQTSSHDFYAGAITSKTLENPEIVKKPVSDTTLTHFEKRQDIEKTNKPQKIAEKNDCSAISTSLTHNSISFVDSNSNKHTNTVLKDNNEPVMCCVCLIEIKRGPFITALGKIWCPEHFICNTPSCRRQLQDLGFVEEQGQLYCEYCFEQYIAPPCAKCSAKIKGDCLRAIGKNFHPECFSCSYCGKLFGNSPFFLEDAQPYCENDWNELFTTKCFACGFPVEAGDRWVEALNNNYHSQCFNCTMCKKNLEGQSFFAKGGRPFCKNHAR